MAKTARSLTGKVVVITGGARGIGAATARALVAEGARVAIGDLDEDFTKRAAKELGPDVLGLSVDVSSNAGYTAFLDEVERELGPIDVLVNNAGIMPLGPLDEESDATTARQLAINLGAVIHGTREAMKRMKPRRSGHIVNVASVAGKVGAPGGATYSATKHGVVGLCEAVYYELDGTGVDITCIMPSIVNTELSAGLGTSRLTPTVQPEDVAAEIVRALKFPTLEVFVPRSLMASNKIMRLGPRRLLDKIATGTKAGSILAAGAHTVAREEYEARAAASAPEVDTAR
jgi:NAD(P)-dependent dehydrogenase (short-subunit alcohol dehydrogenase family)